MAGYVHGISTRSVDELVKALGMSGISKSQVLRLCAEIAQRVQAFLTRPIEGDWPYLWIDATNVKVLEAGRIVSVAVIIAVAVNTDGRREVLGLAVGPSEAEPFWTDFLRSLTRRGLLSDEHFTVDGALIEAWASMKSFKPKDGPGDGPPTGGGGRNPGHDFHGEKRSNATHASTSDPDARLLRKGRGKEAKLCHMAHLLMENQNGLIVDAMLTPASGIAERDAAEAMLTPSERAHRAALGADKGYDTRDFVAAMRALNVPPTSPRPPRAARRSTAGPRVIRAMR